MNTVGFVRLGTALGLCAISALTLYKGIIVASYAIADMAVPAKSDRVDALVAWREQTGVAAAAREPSTIPIKSTEPELLRRRRMQLIDYLAERPMSSSKWLALADVSFSVGESTETIVNEFSMSQLTAPYEGYLMAARSRFGILLWEQSPTDVRLRTARDVAIARLSDDQVENIRILLMTKLKSTREQIRLALLGTEGLRARRLASLGLE